MTKELIKCYQMQIDDNEDCVPVYIGEYPEVPTPLLKIIKHEEYVIHIVCYILTEKEVENKNYNIVGAIIFKNNNDTNENSDDFKKQEKYENSICSLDLVYENKKYRLYYCDHENKKEEKIKTIDGKLKRDDVVPLLIDGVFRLSPTRELLAKK